MVLSISSVGLGLCIAEAVLWKGRLQLAAGVFLCRNWSEKGSVTTLTGNNKGEKVEGARKRPKSSASLRAQDTERWSFLMQVFVFKKMKAKTRLAGAAANRGR